MKNLDWIKTGYFAHRGLHNHVFPENTMAAFLNAVIHNFNIELDIRMTKDNQIIVFHDSTLERLCGRYIKIEETNYEDIKQFTILNTKETIPLLRDVLDKLPDSIHYLIELKPSNKYRKFTTEFVKLMSEYDRTYAIHSFDFRVVNEFRKQAPEIIRGQIASTFSNENHVSNKILKHLLSNFITKPDFINYNFGDLPRKQLDKLYKKGMCIISYVARSQKELNFVRERYDNAVFENFIPEIKS